MSKHTQGDWTITGPNEFLNQVGIGIVSPQGHIDPIAVAYGAGEELVANAKLIAAAPRMLGELKHWVAICPNCDGSGQRLHSFNKCLVPCEKCAPSRTIISMVTA